MIGGRRTTPLIAACLTVAVLLAACGSERQKAPVPEQGEKPRGKRTFEAAGGDVRFRYPANWQLLPAERPALVHIVSGRAIVTVWVYRRQALPKTSVAAKAARKDLVASIRKRDPSFKVISSNAGTFRKAVAIRILGRGRIDRRQVRILSLHIYKGRAEYVVDAIAPQKGFSRVRRAVFDPLIESLRLKGKPRAIPEIGGRRRGEARRKRDRDEREETTTGTGTTPTETTPTEGR